MQSVMQEIEMGDYVNQDQREEIKLDTNQKERRTWHLLFLGFGVLCIIQATLNLSLRLSLYSSQISSHSDCNTTHFMDNDQNKEENMNCKQENPGHCNELQERFNALVKDKNLLENRNNILVNRIKTLEEDNEKLKIKLGDLKGCVLSQRCPPEWMEINSRCYFLSREAKTWANSRKHCLSYGADLVIINSEQEQRDIYRLDENPSLLFWIGLRDTNVTFKWVDGSQPTQFFWEDGQPDYSGPDNVYCVEINRQNPVLNCWNDTQCGQRLRWLCERDLCINQ